MFEKETLSCLELAQFMLYPVRQPETYWIIKNLLKFATDFRLVNCTSLGVSMLEQKNNNRRGLETMEAIIRITKFDFFKSLPKRLY